MAKGFERLLPGADREEVEQEQAVLGSIMIDPDVLPAVMSILEPEDFYRDAHKEIYRAILALDAKHEPADFLQICEELGRQKKLDTIDEDYVTSLVNLVPTSANAEYYADKVAAHSMQRQLIHMAGEAAKLGYEQDPEAMEKVEQLLFSINKRKQKTKGFKRMEEVMSDYSEELEMLNNHTGELVGIPTKLKDLDRTLSGLNRTDLILLAARPAMGKTSAALTIAMNAALQGYKVAIFSLEMGSRQLARRLTSMKSNIDMQKLRRGFFEDDEWDRVAEALGNLSSLPIYINDTAGNIITSMESQLRALIQQEGGIDLVIVDYLQLVGGVSDDNKRNRNREQEISEISRNLKRMARTYNLPVLALAQLSRAVESRAVKVPQLSDLRESGALEQDADVILFIYRDEYYNPDSERKGQADIIIAKHRNGPTGEVALKFSAAETRFSDLLEVVESGY